MSPNYRWQLVGMLWCISFFNYADRQAIFSVFPLLERDLHLDSAQLGLLASAFAWAYGLFSPLAGVLVDRIQRRTAILGGLHIWSVICAATAWAGTFPQLLFFRAAEGLGETMYFPASMSMVSDYHGKATRSRALSLHQTSVYTGTIAGGYFAGLIGQHYGWRWSFVVFGGLGILLGIVLHRKLVEPQRGAMDHPGIAIQPMPLGEFFRTVARTPTALLLVLAFISANAVAAVLLSWMPKFVFDRFHLDLATSGLVATSFVQIASMCGAPFGGWLADTWRRRTRAGRILVQSVGVLGGAPFVVICAGTGSLGVLMAALTGWGLFKGIYDSNIWASLFDVIRPEARGRAVGLMNAVGWGGGGTASLAIGLLARERPLGEAMGYAAGIYLVAAAFLITAALFFADRDAGRLENAHGA